MPLQSDSIRLHIVRAIRADIDINHNSIIIFEQFSTPPCIRWSVRLYVPHLCNICHMFCYVMFHLEVSCPNSYTKLKLYNICFTCNIVFHNIVHSDGVLYYLLTDYDVFYSY